MKYKKILLFFYLFSIICLISCSANSSSKVVLESISGENVSSIDENIKKVNPLNKKNNNNETRDELVSQMSSVNQTIVLLDNNKYANVTIKLDNPYEYYICDFYMNYSELGAEIYVDDEWIPLDGETKIRWTGSTNRKATYLIYLPNVNENSQITLTDMRYLDKKEVAVDISRHNVAEVYSIDNPINVIFVANSLDYYYFRLDILENCNVNIEGASYDDNLKLYKSNGGTYRVEYTYLIPNTQKTISGVISHNYTLLSIQCGLLPEQGDYAYGDVGSWGSMDLEWGFFPTFYISNFRIRGTGFTLEKGDDSYYKGVRYMSSYDYFKDYNEEMKISINGGAFYGFVYREMDNNGGVSGWGQLCTKGGYCNNSSPCRITLKWNDIIIFDEYVNGWVM